MPGGDPPIGFGMGLISTLQGGYPIRRIHRQSGGGGVIDKVGRFMGDSPPSKSGNFGGAIIRRHIQYDSSRIFTMRGALLRS